MKMKRQFMGVAVATMLLTGMVGPQSGFAAASPEIKVTVDGKQVQFLDAKPYIDKQANRTMVPIRFISENLNAKVDWDKENHTVKIDRNGTQISLKIGENELQIGERRFSIDSPAVIKEDRTFVPLRAITRAFDVYVKWDGAKRLVVVESNPVIKDVTGKDFPVNNNDPRFQAFHQGLTIKNGVLTGKVPMDSPTLYVNCLIELKNGQMEALNPGQSFSYRVDQIKVMGILINDQAKKKELASYTYRSFPDLIAEAR